MKWILIIGDGMADYPLEELNNKTPLEVASKPNIDLLAEKGRVGILKTIPEGLEPGSGVALLTILGYDPKRFYMGRGPTEAISKGIPLDHSDVAFRCNLITEEKGILTDYSADHIGTCEAEKLIESLRKNLEKKREINFYSGVGYRHLLVMRGKSHSQNVSCTPPHDATGIEISKILPGAKTSDAQTTASLLREIILESRTFLSNHPINIKRLMLGKLPGNLIWPWGPGRKLEIPTLKERFGITGEIISAVDLVKGIGASLGMKIIDVPGATGYFDTNYENKAKYALKALESHDLVLIHVEAPDEAGHNGDYEQKIKSIEDMDKRLLEKLFEGLDQEYTIALLPDHYTPVKVKTHTADPIPFLICSPRIKPDTVKSFDEISAKNGGFGFLEGESFMTLLVGIGSNQS